MLDDGIKEDDGREETGVHEGEITEDVAADGMSDADYGQRHFFSENVDHVQEIPGVVAP